MKTNTSKFIRLYGLTLTELAKKIGCSAPTAYKLHSCGRLRHLEMSDPVEAFKKIDSRVIHLIHNINSRCNNKNDKRYERYGGRGIKNLLSMEDILMIWERDGADKMKKPSLDRVDSDDNYCIDNCRFIEMSENTDKGKLEHLFEVLNTKNNLTEKEKNVLEFLKNHLNKK